MAKAKVLYQCNACGWSTPKWVGQCRDCGEWGTLAENAAVGSTGSAPTVRQPAQPVTQVDATQAQAFPSGISELDRVLGPGITPGAVILLVGEPGVGKSTLLLDVAARFARMAVKRGPVLYATGEESAAQVRLRADRIGALTDNLLLAAENSLESVVAHIQETSPSLIVLDSVQTFTTASADGAAGGVNQVKGVASEIIAVAKDRHIPTILVGHVTKDGNLAGPRTLEHLVDVVCQFEGDRHTPLRLLRAVKNRYGATDEVGCFQLTDAGIEEVPDPSVLFTTSYSEEIPGSCTTMTLEGNRPMAVEIQALVAPGGGGSGRRTVAGVDPARVGMVLAVLQARLGLDLKDMDVYVSTVGGAPARGPSSDLAIGLALLSATSGKPIALHSFAVGEVGLTGDIRGCAGLGRRIQESARLGYKIGLIPQSQSESTSHMKDCTLIPVRTLSEAWTQSLA